MFLAGISTSAKRYLWADIPTSPPPLSCRDAPHDGTDITRQVPAAGGGGEVLLGVQPVSVNHEVSISQVA